MQQGFSKTQISEIDQDESLVKDLLKSFDQSVNKVKTILLYSNRYRPKDPGIRKYEKITWDDLHNSNFKDGKLFELANGKFRK